MRQWRLVGSPSEARGQVKIKGEKMKEDNIPDSIVVDTKNIPGFIQTLKFIHISSKHTKLLPISAPGLIMQN